MTSAMRVRARLRERRKIRDARIFSTLFKGLEFEKYPRFRPHRHGHDRVRRRLARPETETLNQGGENDLGLDHGEIGADADARARTERQILIFVALGA